MKLCLTPILALLWLVFALTLVAKPAMAVIVNYNHLANQAFAEKNYRKALLYYQKAEQAHHKKNGVLYYNMGVTYYRLGEYRQAETYLDKATAKNPRNSLAFLNLGLAQVKLNKLDSAQQKFERVIQLGASHNITDMAQTMLERIQKAKSKPAKTTVPLILNAYLGYQDETETITEEEIKKAKDSYLQLMAIYYRQLNNDYKNGYGFSVTGFGLFYHDQSEYNLTMIAANADKSFSSGSWLSKFGAEFNEMNLGGDAFQLNSYLYASFRYPIKQNFVAKLKIKAGYIYALNDEFDYLNGTQHNIYSSLRLQQNQQKLTAHFDFENNNRSDIDTVDLKSSQSPERYRLKLNYILQQWQPYELRFLAEYRYSKYPGNYRSDTVDKKRNENRLRSLFGITRQISNKLSVMLDWEYTNNRSTINSYDYSRHQVALGLEYIN